MWAALPFGQALAKATEHPIQTFRSVFQVVVGGAGIALVIFWPRGYYLSQHGGKPKTYDTSAPGWGGGSKGSGTGSSASSSPAGTASTIGEAVQKGGWPQEAQAQAAAVANRESSGVANLANCWDSNYYAGYPSIGLYQIILPTAQSVDSGATNKKLTDPVYNSQVAAKIYQQQGWGPWTTAAGWQGWAGMEGTPITTAPANGPDGISCVYG